MQGFHDCDSQLEGAKENHMTSNTTLRTTKMIALASLRYAVSPRTLLRLT